MSTTSSPASSAAGQLINRAVIHLALVVAAVVTLFPLLWMFTTAFTPNELTFRRSLGLLPMEPTFANFVAAFKIQPVAHWLVNSVITSVAIAAGKMAIAIPAAFAFAHFRFKGRDWLFALIVGTMTIPYVVTLIPTYIAIVKVDLYNTLAAVIIPSIAFCGFAIFFLRQSFKVVPTELLEAGVIDGAGPLRALVSIVIPNSLPAIASLSVLSFLSAWNLYLWPHLVLNDADMKTLSIGLKLFATNQEQLQQWGPLMATAVLGLLPALTIFSFAQKYIMDAFVHSGIK
ncbi:carbohydrate ABC transporter permease [Reyranella sp.]|uniref:carbohydrate ABC transporter permease n=1 Tax=Reyranella sp. TaxID=1929291 RepID=UPI0037841ED0